MIVNCKINLGLQILRKRIDGFHEIDTVFYPTDFFTDKLTLEESDKELEFICRSTQDIGNKEDNLCVKAFRMLQTDYGIGGVRIILEKGIPSGAGLGGGSADAAFTLKMLVEHFHLSLTNTQLMRYATRLGSDVPFFLANRAMHASGRGEILEPIDLNLEDYSIRIVAPKVSISTREAYAGVTPKKPLLYASDIVRKPISLWKDLLHNDFEDSIFKQIPNLAKLKNNMYDNGAIYAAMTGSGSAIFGIFPKS